MQRLTSTSPSGWRRVVPWFGVGAAVIAALTVFVASLVAPDTATWWVIALAIGGLAAGVALEYLAGRGLERWERRRHLAVAVERLQARTPRGLATLLSPHRAGEVGLPLLGRDEELADLVAWCTGPGTAFRLITGPGGIGKTRLADELQLGLRAAGQGWQCLFLSTAEAAHAGAVATLRERAGDRPVLVIVDYAENRPGLGTLLADAFADTGRLRVLMLARQPGDWWDRLTSTPGGLGDALHAGYRYRDLPDVEAAPQAVVDAAANAFATYLGVLPVPHVRLDDDPPFRVLDLTTIALVAVLDAYKNPGRSTAVDLVSIGQVFTELLRHEADQYWQATARETGVDDALTIAMRRVLVAAVALLGAADQATTQALAARVLDTFADQAHADPVAAARWLRRTYPSGDDAGHWVEPITPDRVAEHLVVEILTVTPRPTGRRVTALLEQLSDDQAVQAMTVLSRAATDPARDRDQRTAIRVLADHLAAHLPAHQPSLDKVLAAVPQPSETMAPTAVYLAQAQLDLLESTNDPDPEQIANATHVLGRRLHGLGRLNEAMPALERAVNTYDRLVQDDAARYEPALAAALNDFGTTVAELGQHDHALAVVQRAVKIWEQLAQADTERHEPGLAIALSTLSIRLSTLRRMDLAVAASQRAVDTFQRLARADPDRYEHWHAAVLASHGVRLGMQKRLDDALAVAQQAVDLYGRLARIHPDRYEPGYARALNSLGSRLAALGRMDTAVSATMRAVEIRERLAASGPERHGPALADTLDGLGALYARNDQMHKARAAAQRAVDLYQQFTPSDPGRHEPGQARALYNLGNYLWALNRPDDAASVAERSVAIRERLAPNNRARSNPDHHHEMMLARTLDSLSAWYQELGRVDSAVPPLERAADLYQQLASHDPAHYQADHERVQALLEQLRYDNG
ncbi:tetratricopeptide repeat protein [Promicromonospora sukumoe]